MSNNVGILLAGGAALIAVGAAAGAYAMNKPASTGDEVVQNATGDEVVQNSTGDEAGESATVPQVGQSTTVNGEATKVYQAEPYHEEAVPQSGQSSTVDGAVPQSRPQPVQSATIDGAVPQSGPQPVQSSTVDGAVPQSGPQPVQTATGDQAATKVYQAEPEEEPKDENKMVGGTRCKHCNQHLKRKNTKTKRKRK